jgi:uncharacterized membrane protein
MAKKSVSDTLQETLAQVVREAIGNIGGEEPQKAKKGGLRGGKGLFAGAGLAAAAPLLKKAVDALQDGSLDKMIADLRERAEAGVPGVSGSSDDSDDGSGEAPRPEAEGSEDGEGQKGDAGEGRDDEDGGDDDREPSGGPQATGKGRRMPVQQAVDVGVPLETAYNQFTQFEDWPEFMHRVTRVTQEDECTVKFATKIWGKTKEFEAKVETQRPDERIKWKVAQGITHAGVVTFHELAPNLTRIEVTLDVQPGSLIEKAARGMRHVKRAVRADLHRYKAFIEMQELETGAWRGVIEDGEVVEPHDESYDEEREYSDVEDLRDEAEGSGEEEDEQGEPEEQEEEQPVAESDEGEDEEDEQPVATSDEQDEEDAEPVAESDADEDEAPAEAKPQRRAKQAHGRRSRTGGSNGSGKPERVGSGSGRRARRSAAG